MESSRSRGDPDFSRHGMSVDDDLATVLAFDFQYATGGQLEIDIRPTCLEGAVDARQHGVRQPVEFTVIHRDTIPLFASSDPNMSRIATLLIILSLAACGIKGPLELPAKTGKPVPAGGADVSTAQRSQT